MNRNLERQVYPILGLPFDTITMEKTIDLIFESVTDQSSLFFSTPNLNFIVNSFKNNQFRQSVLESDLNIADGMPIVMLAKFLNIPIKERVSGSNLIDELLKSEKCKAKPIKVFFFGGMEGVAKQACMNVNNMNSGLDAVGYYFPGFGSVEEMSQDHIIEEINATHADFIIVSLGAIKGQQWIMKNRSRLSAPVISHLGAVVNFLAGEYARAPKFIQKIGLEWVWRIKEEPALWKRYILDGISFIGLLVTKIIPYKYYLYLQSRKKQTKGSFTIGNSKRDEIIYFFQGDISKDELENLKNSILKLDNSYKVIIDLRNVEHISSAFLGFLIIITNNVDDMLIRNMPEELKKILKMNCLEYLLPK